MVRKSEFAETTDVTKSVGRFMQTLRKEAKISQTKAAEHLGKTQAYISVRENGLDAFTVEDIERLGRLYNVGGYFAVTGRLYDATFTSEGTQVLE